MKTAVISDIHANLEALRAVLSHARAAGADDFVCLGDVVGYNADPAACIDELRGMGELRCVLGNHDAMAVGQGPLIGISDQARAAITWTRQALDDDHKAWLAGLPLTITDADVTFCHASLAEPSAWRYVLSAGDARHHFDHQATRLAFMGHSHMMFAWMMDGAQPEEVFDPVFETSAGGRWLISVGSVGQPRDGDPRAGYDMLDHDTGRVSPIRVAYDVAAAQAKILAAGLPSALADRLD